jgi:hypothetical protein
LNESFLFVINEAMIENNLTKATVAWSAVREQLAVDGCARQFVASEAEIDVLNIDSLQVLLSSEMISLRQSQRLLGNVLAEYEFRVSVSELFNIMHSDESV